jgi:CheY-like chemotaxis protein
MEEGQKELKFLVVEDSTTTRNNICKMIKKYIEAPSFVLTAITKNEASELYDENTDLDFVIADLDINSGEDSTQSKINFNYAKIDTGGTLNNALGLYLLKEIRSKNKDITLIAFTNFDSEYIKAELRAIEAHYVKKRTMVHEPLKLVTYIIGLLTT